MLDGQVRGFYTTKNSGSGRALNFHCIGKYVAVIFTLARITDNNVERER